MSLEKILRCLHPLLETGRVDTSSWSCQLLEMISQSDIAFKQFQAICHRRDRVHNNFSARLTWLEDAPKAFQQFLRSEREELRALSSSRTSRTRGSNRTTSSSIIGKRRRHGDSVPKSAVKRPWRAGYEDATQKKTQALKGSGQDSTPCQGISAEKGGAREAEEQSPIPASGQSGPVQPREETSPPEGDPEHRAAARANPSNTKFIEPHGGSACPRSSESQFLALSCTKSTHYRVSFKIYLTLLLSRRAIKVGMNYIRELQPLQRPETSRGYSVSMPI